MEGETISLTNGCVCCSMRDDLVEALEQLLAQEPCPEMIVVETSGVSDPRTAAMAIVMSTGLAAATQLDAIITVIDASELLELDELNTKLAQDQIEVADIAIINKIDLAGSETSEQVSRYTRKIAPKSRIIEAVHADVSLELLLGLSLHEDRTFAFAGTTAGSHGHESHGHADHTHAYAGYSWQSDAPLSFESAYGAFQSLPLSVFRCKGILQLREVPDKQVILQMTGKRVTLAKGVPWYEMTPSSRIVAIGAAGKLDTGDLDRRFESCISHGTGSSANPVTQAVIEILRRP